MSNDPWIRLNKNAYKPRLRLFCFPHAGGGCSSYRSWSLQMPAEIELLCLQLPGREARLHETPFERIEPLTQYLEGAFSKYHDAPFAFFGHSMGSIVCFEFARALRRAGRPLPVVLMVSGVNAPHVAHFDEQVHVMSDEALTQKLGEINGTPSEILQNKELMELLLPGLRADFSLLASYHYHVEAPLDMPIIAMGGIRDQSLTKAGLNAWAEHTTADFRTIMFPGDHFYTRSHEREVLDVIVAKLRRAMLP